MIAAPGCPYFRDPQAARTRGPYTTIVANPHSCFPDKETEAHEQEGTCLRSHSRLVPGSGLDPVTQFRAHVVSITAASWLGTQWRLSQGVGLTLSSGEGRGLTFAEHPGVPSCSRSFTLRSFQWAPEVDSITVPILHTRKLVIRD